MMFKIGITFGLRIGDLRELKVKDLRGKRSLILNEEKTGKQLKIDIPLHLQRELFDYTRDMDDDEYMFQSRKGKNQPITKIQAYRVMVKAGEVLGREDIGTHTMRKTFGYFHYKTYNNLGSLMSYFRHSSQAVTLAYIGVTNEQHNTEVAGLNFYD